MFILSWDVQVERRSAARPALNAQRRTNQRRPLRHSDQTKGSSLPRIVLLCFHIEPLPVILDYHSIAACFLAWITC